MPNFQPDLTQVTVNFPILEKGDYEILVGEPKAFIRDKSDGSGQSYGVRYPLQLAEDYPGYKKGTRLAPFNGVMSSEGGQSFAKRFLMACLGFKSSKTDEKRFDETFKGDDWSFDTDNGTVGDMWRKANSARLVVSFDIGINSESGEQQQKWGTMRPVTA